MRHSWAVVLVWGIFGFGAKSPMFVSDKTHYYFLSKFIWLILCCWPDTWGMLLTMFNTFFLSSNEFVALCRDDCEITPSKIPSTRVSGKWRALPQLFCRGASDKNKLGLEQPKVQNNSLKWRLGPTFGIASQSVLKQRFCVHWWNIGVQEKPFQWTQLLSDFVYFRRWSAFNLKSVNVSKWPWQQKQFLFQFYLIAMFLLIRARNTTSSGRTLHAPISDQWTVSKTLSNQFDPWNFHAACTC